jgi:hypothetical protein
MATDVIESIKTYIKTQLEGLTPTTSSFKNSFREAKGTESLSSGTKDSRFHRSFRLVTVRNMQLRRPWGATAGEYSKTLTVLIGYNGQQDDITLQKLMDSDEELIVKTVTNSGQSWPTGFSNIVPLNTGQVVELGVGTNAVIMTIPFTVTYDVT